MKENVGPASEKVNMWERGWRARVERLDFVREVFSSNGRECRKVVCPCREVW